MSTKSRLKYESSLGEEVAKRLEGRPFVTPSRLKCESSPGEEVAKRLEGRPFVTKSRLKCESSLGEEVAKRLVGRPFVTKSRPKHASSARGMAVVGALLIVLVATLLVTGLLQRQDIAVRSAENRFLQAQGQWLLRGGMDWASMVLRYDGRNYNITAPGQLWSIPVEDTRISQSDTGRVAVFSGRIEDEQGKFNLRNLAEQGAWQLEALAGLQRLLETLELETGLATRLAERVALSQAMVLPDGTQVREPQYPALQTIDDLLALEAITPEILEQLRPYLTVLPETSGTNVNTASPEVLMAAIPNLSLAHARSVTAQRDRGVSFLDSTDFINRLGLPDARVDANALVVNSQWFLVKGAVTLDHAVVATRALLHRNRDIVQPVWIREFH